MRCYSIIINITRVPSVFKVQSIVLRSHRHFIFSIETCKNHIKLIEALKMYSIKKYFRYNNISKKIPKAKNTNIFPKEFEKNNLKK